MKYICVLSLGAGVQSSTLALMCAAGVFGRVPDAAIFADTQWEPKAVYEWLALLETLLPFPVFRVSRGNLRDAVYRNRNATGQRFASIPWFVLNQDWTKGMGRRQCTREYKIEPIREKVRELMGYSRGQRVKTKAEVWIGISTDEATRAKPSPDAWQTNVWPLLDLGYSRKDCLLWLDLNFPQLPSPPKSACIGCPFHSDAHWAAMKADDPESWNDAVAADAAIRHQPKFRGLQFAHRSLAPLDRVVFKGQDTRDHFDNECEGICGV